MLNHLQSRRVLTGLALITICTPFLVLITSAYNLVQDYLTIYVAGLVFLSIFSIATVSTAFLSRF
jgi:hypothetical protein